MLVTSVVALPSLAGSASRDSDPWLSGSNVLQAPAILAILWFAPRLASGHKRWPFWRLTYRALPGFLGAGLGFLAGCAAVRYAMTWGAWVELVPQAICWWALSSLLMFSSVKIAHLEEKRKAKGAVAKRPEVVGES
ncbi:MAG TPA: hypothetical protein VNJ54_17060 [Plantibacter sp.]|uniref:hypothetical protein n=1 Tax=Plantibacter sp. RU18 TaxID=3158143 RepID=UPI002C2B50C1|nr:hypothetical protein [Plantibacter sp.]